MGVWRERFRVDPVPRLLASAAAVEYWTRRDLLGEDVGPPTSLWELREPRRIIARQRQDGSWAIRPGKQHLAVNPAIIETWRYLRSLVQQYGMCREHPAVHRAAEYLFSCQAAAGDLRGIIGNQYATYYTGAMAAVLIEAGYGDDERIGRALAWLLAMRQDDGGWSVPLITHRFDRETQHRLTTERVDPVEPDRRKPFSHNATGMVLRGFAAHPKWRESAAVRRAAGLLKSRFFQPDAYTSYHNAAYWVRFEYPFWWNNLVAAMDSLSLIGLPADDPDMTRAVSWLVDHQEPDGLWRVSYAGGSERESPRAVEMRPWIGLAIRRVCRRLCGE